MSLKKLTPIAAAITLGLTAMTAPVVASAETSASIAASNFYLWRGESLSDGAPAISGSLDYSHGSGAYAGVWTSSEHNITSSDDSTPTSEVDLYMGYSGEAGAIGYDVSLWSYQYPEADGSDDIGNASELAISASMAGANVTIYKSLQGQAYYITFGYEMNKLGMTLGTTLADENEEDTLGHLDSVSHLNLSYAANDELTFTFSKLVDAPTTADDDMLVNVTWTKSFDL